ncbi:unnamed protein product [Paramecium octaurelia]|uniref:Uncharacterized protein n=1 Tax=Paramecium octaurelia TaxID=43137 RepID=A0A8S1WZU0_PAROT|nr:unnamed protein product [Paramecium octaurelia]
MKKILNSDQYMLQTQVKAEYSRVKVVQFINQIQMMPFQMWQNNRDQYYQFGHKKCY